MFDLSDIHPNCHEAYIEGYNDAKNFEDLQDEKYPGSGHERDTTFLDELAYAYYQGQMDFHDEDE